MKEKFEKWEVEFGPAKAGGDRCDECVHFEPWRHGCGIVKGVVKASEWCNQWKEARER
jgi:hypothetical protein